MRAAALFSACAGAAAGAAAGSSVYSVAVVEQPPSPVISYLDGNTAWPQSFNPSFVQPPVAGGKRGLLVRSQNCSFTPGQCVGCNVDPAHPIAPWFPGSVITFAEQHGDGSFAEPYLVFAPNASAPVSEEFGTEDPRLAFDASTGLYHLFYTCYGSGGPFLCHATTTDPTAPFPGSWTRYGKVFPALPAGTKSGALLIRDSPPHYLYWGAGRIALATSTDLVTFTTVNSSFITARPGYFDNQLVEAGPPPLRLSDGNYLFIHNSDNATSPPSGDFDAYNVGEGRRSSGVRRSRRGHPGEPVSGFLASAAPTRQRLDAMRVPSPSIHLHRACRLGDPQRH